MDNNGKRYQNIACVTASTATRSLQRRGAHVAAVKRGACAIGAENISGGGMRGANASNSVSNDDLRKQSCRQHQQQHRAGSISVKQHQNRRWAANLFIRYRSLTLCKQTRIAYSS